MTSAMKFRSSLLAALVLVASSSLLRAEPLLQPFKADSLPLIEARYQGEPFLLVLWSVTCAPCIAELALVAEALRADPQLPVVLVSADPPALQAETEAVLADHGLLQHAGWQFADMPEKLRFHIDPDWFGELPRSYFHDGAGQRVAHSGALTREQLAQWFGMERVAAAKTTQ